MYVHRNTDVHREIEKTYAHKYTYIQIYMDMDTYTQIHAHADRYTHIHAWKHLISINPKMYNQKLFPVAL